MNTRLRLLLLLVFLMLSLTASVAPAQTYLKQFGNDRDSYAQSVRKFVVAYEKALREFELNKAYTAKNYIKVIDAGTAILAKDPDDYFVLAMIAQAGYDLSRSDASRNNQTVEHARHALLLLDSGSVTKPFLTCNHFCLNYWT